MQKRKQTRKPIQSNRKRSDTKPNLKRKEPNGDEHQTKTKRQRVEIEIESKTQRKRNNEILNDPDSHNQS